MFGRFIVEANTKLKHQTANYKIRACVETRRNYKTQESAYEIEVITKHTNGPNVGQMELFLHPHHPRKNSRCSRNYSRCPRKNSRWSRKKVIPLNLVPALPSSSNSFKSSTDHHKSCTIPHRSPTIPQIMHSHPQSTHNHPSSGQLADTAKKSWGNPSSPQKTYNASWGPQTPTEFSPQIPSDSASLFGPTLNIKQLQPQMSDPK